jgi:hypothetical protein
MMGSGGIKEMELSVKEIIPKYQKACGLLDFSINQSYNLWIRFFITTLEAYGGRVYLSKAIRYCMLQGI